MTALLAPSLAHGQCQPVALSKPSQTQKSARRPEFFDQPHFTVAGVTDTSNPGGHGSDAVRRSKEALEKQAASLKTPSEAANPGPSSPGVISEKSLHEAAGRDPADFETNMRLGQLLLADGKTQDALPYLQKASRLHPQDGEVHHALGDAEEKLNHSVEAVGQYQRAAELDPSEPNLFDWGAELLLHRAPEPATEVFGKGNRLFPGSARMLVGLGVAWYARGSYEQAARCLCEAVELNPADPNPYVFLGKIQKLEATPSEGIAERLARFARLQPNNALANYYYAVSLWQQRTGPDDKEKVAAAESLLDKAVQLDPNLGAAFLQSGVLYSEEKNYSKAILAYQNAIKASPELAEAHYRLAQIYRLNGDKSGAKREIEIYQQLSKAETVQAERERHEIQRFVYTLREPASQP